MATFSHFASDVTTGGDVRLCATLAVNFTVGGYGNHYGKQQESHLEPPKPCPLGVLSG
jgi:hypothetical protein